MPTGQHHQKATSATYTPSPKFVHGADINKTMYIVLTSRERQHLMNHNVINIDTASVPSEAAGMYRKLHLFQTSAAAIKFHITRSAVAMGPDSLYLVAIKAQGIRHLISENILSPFIRLNHQLFELENHQHRLDVGTIGYIQAIFRGASPAQLHQRTTS